MRKIKLLLCALTLMAPAAVAVSINAQKHSSGGEAKAEVTSAAPQDATARQGAKAHPDCPLMSGSNQDCPMKGEDKPSSAARDGGHDAHLAALNARGEKAMGFSQTETTHHFILKPDGGLIQVEVKDAEDAQNREHIRQHLAHVARAFAAGDFDTPMLVHERVPPGVPVMQRLSSEIAYVYEETERGARVRIKTRNAEALAAVHDFLRFQIADHQTGDSLEVK